MQVLSKLTKFILFCSKFMISFYLQGVFTTFSREYFYELPNLAHRQPFLLHLILITKIYLECITSEFDKFINSILGFSNCFYSILLLFFHNFSNYKLGRVNPDAENAELRSWFWDHSEKVTGTRFPTST